MNNSQNITTQENLNTTDLAVGKSAGDSLVLSQLASTVSKISSQRLVIRIHKTMQRIVDPLELPGVPDPAAAEQSSMSAC